MFILVIVYSCYCLDEPLLSLVFDMNPVNSKFHQYIRLTLLPVEVTYNGPTINNLLDLFVPPTPIKLQTMTNSVTATLASLRTQTRAGLENVINNRRIMDIDITLNSPIVYIPDNGVLTDTSSVLVVNLGSLSIKSDMKHIIPDVRVSVVVVVIMLLLLLLLFTIIGINV